MTLHHRVISLLALLASLIVSASGCSPATSPSVASQAAAIAESAPSKPAAAETTASAEMPELEAPVAAPATALVTDEAKTEAKHDPKPPAPPMAAKPVVAEQPAIELAAAPENETQAGPQTSDSKNPAKDPVKQNGPIFENWPDPQLALLITGELGGYVEPCGCAGLENQKGGLSRRYSLTKQLAGRGWTLAAVDLGDLVNRQGTQAELKFQMAVEALRAMDYSLVGLGADDLRLGAGILLAATTEPDGKPNRFAAANVGLFELDLDSPERYRIIERGGRKIGVVAVLGRTYQKDVTSDDIKLADPIEALEKIVPKLASADFKILLSYAPPKETEQLAERFPAFNAVVTAGGSDEPPRQPRRIGDRGTILIELGHKGMFAIVLGLYDDAAQPVRYQRVPLDARFPDSPEMKALMAGYQQQLHTLGFEGLGLRPVVNPRGTSASDPAGHYIGSEACGKCHTKAFGIWKDTPHASATDTLVKLNPSRQFDPECVSCHVTGWKPQEFVPYATGYASVSDTPHLKGNGCENCHGPGAGHAAAEAGSDLALRNKLRLLMRSPRDDTGCIKCHDLDNSPEFDFSTYWPQVEHKGKD